MRPVEESCYWLAARNNYALSPVVAGDQDAEVVIIGAGFTGLWTAYFLKELAPDLDIAVVEQETVGYGASGRNAGMVSNCMDHSHALAIAHFGRQEAERLMRIGLANIDELAEFAADCDFERTGQLFVALNAEHLESCRENAEVAAQLGLPGHRVLSAEEVRKELNSPLYRGGIFMPGGGIIDPIKLTDKLKRVGMERGVRFFEHSRVTAVEDDRVVTRTGSIRGKKIVLAANAYSHLLFPRLINRFIPLYDYVLVSDPLSDSQHRELGWHNRQGVMDGRNFFNYYRLTRDNRILWGTSEAVYFPPNRVDETCDHSEDHYESLEESFRNHFPYLADLRFPFRWGGPIASTTRLTPVFGSMRKDRIIYALGYTGHGIGTTRVAGKILAHMALAKPSDLLSLRMVRVKPFPYPPEPMRRASVNMVTSSLKGLDQGERPSPILKILDLFGIGFSS